MNMIDRFRYNQPAVRVVMGSGAIGDVGSELAALGINRALLICGPSRPELRDRCCQLMGERFAAYFDRVKMHVPVETVQDVEALAREIAIDGAVLIGGGSAIGTGKALALATNIPLLAIPTTYAGSEMTPLYGTTEGGTKFTGQSENVRPRTVIYDVDLTTSIPLTLSVTSGLNAIAHAVEALYSSDSNPFSTLAAEEGIRAMASGLKRLADGANQSEARFSCLYGAWLCGSVLGTVRMGLHHKLCHVLGGLQLPHSELHAVLLPFVFRFNAPYAADASHRIARALGGRDGVTELFVLVKKLGAPTSLRAIGMSRIDLGAVVHTVANARFPNPAPVDEPSLRALMADAFVGAAA